LLDISLVVATILFYLFLTETLGFVISGFVILAVLFHRLGASWKANLPTSIFVVVIIYQLFAVYLRVPLPRGLLGW
jgi:putative tricarboxylic transport membrane protein